MRGLLLVSTLLLAACGQAGDLYLPPAEPAQPEAVPPAAPAEQPAPDDPANKKKEPK